MVQTSGAGAARGRRSPPGRARRARRSAAWSTIAVLSLIAASGCEPDLIIGSWSRSTEPLAGSGGASAAGGAGAGGAGGVAGGTGGAGAGTGGTTGGTSGVGGGGGTDAGAAGVPDTAGAGGEPGCDAVFVTDAGEGGAPSGPVLTPVEVPWSTGFENDFCDYAEARGFCYETGEASFTSVTAPVRSGQSAAAFTANSSAGASHARCVRQGTFPVDAYYSAWFYLATAATEAGNWNLIYINGAIDGELVGLWDVSIGFTEEGGLLLYVFDQIRRTRIDTTVSREVRSGEWFHVEFRLVRAADETGLIALYQDGELLLEVSGIVTDESSWSQFYVGNLVDGIAPPESTVYVDDVSIRAAP